MIYQVIGKQRDLTITVQNGDKKGKFNYSSKSELEKFGFYDIKDSDGYDPSIHDRGELKFNKSKKAFIYSKSNKTWSESLADLKTNKKAEGLTLEFSEKPFNLKKWIINDIFGEKTTVLIQNAKYNNKLSHLLFFPDDFPEPNNSD